MISTSASAPLIALEIHDASLWEPTRVLPIVETMEAWGYNALVLHQNELLDACTQLGLTANYGVSDLRLKKVRNRAAWMVRLTERLAEFGAELFLEIKEPSFEDYALELYPGLVGADGKPDPLAPDWTTFCRAKVEDLLARVPDLGGLVVNLSSPESRVSLPDHLAAVGAEIDEVDWFEAMIAAFHEPLVAAGKRLYVRDFSYTADMTSAVLAAVDRFGGAVGASIKITAHDYFPEFPENPAAGATTSPVIFEFEAFGEHMGWSVIPNCRVAEFAKRMEGYRSHGAVGFLMRTSWEAIAGANALDTLSSVNVHALPRLIDGDVAPETLVAAWLDKAFGVTGDLAVRATRLLLDSWEVPAASYWSGRVFPRHSCLPSSWQEGWLSMESKGMGRRDRDLSVTPDHPWVCVPEADAVLARSEAAVALADRLAAEAWELSTELPAPIAGQFGAFRWLPIFARQHLLAQRGVMARVRGEDVGVIKDELEMLARDAEAALGDALPQARVLLDPEQMRKFATSLST